MSHVPVIIWFIKDLAKWIGGIGIGAWIMRWWDDREVVMLRVEVAEFEDEVDAYCHQGVEGRILIVTNCSKVPITITACGYVDLFPDSGCKKPVEPPKEITRNQQMECFFDVEVDDGIDYWVAWDSRNKPTKLRVASSYHHWKSETQKWWASMKIWRAKRKLNALIRKAER
jgi:hypothetical protein